MSAFQKKVGKDGKYHVPGKGEEWVLREYSDADIKEWANDPNCIECDQCSKEMKIRENYRAAREVEIERAKREKAEQLSIKRQNLSDNPFDPRTEVSEDARYIASHIVKTLWIIFVLLPVVAWILFEILQAMR